MRKILIAVVVLSSCTNPKEKIVEQQKQVNKALEKDSEVYTRYSSVENVYKQYESDAARAGDIETAVKFRDKINDPGLQDTISKYSRRADSLHKLYDSLEMEIKKY